MNFFFGGGKRSRGFLEASVVSAQGLRIAMDEEIKSITKNDSLDLAILRERRKAIGVKWVFEGESFKTGLV